MVVAMYVCMGMINYKLNMLDGHKSHAYILNPSRWYCFSPVINALSDFVSYHFFKYQLAGN